MRTLAAPIAGQRAMRGLSLIELMVSLTIGLILMVAIVSAYLGSASASRMAEAQGRMTEDAQAALSIITQHLRLAGNNPKQPDYSDGTPRNPAFPAGSFALRGCDATFGNFTSEADPSLITCTAGTTSVLPDSILVRYEADPYNTVKNAAGIATDCLGQVIPDTAGVVNKWDGISPASGVPAAIPTPATNVNFKVADNRFYIASLSGIPNLYCKGNGGNTAQPIVENIEDLQFVYGVANTVPATATDVAGYLTAAQMRDAGVAPTLAGVAEDTRWGRVMAIRLCVVARSETPVSPDADSAKYYNCAGTLTTPGDLFLRRAYSTTVVLRNRVTPS